MFGFGGDSLHSLSLDMSSQLDVSWHDGDSDWCLQTDQQDRPLLLLGGTVSLLTGTIALS